MTDNAVKSLRLCSAANDEADTQGQAQLMNRARREGSVPRYLRNPPQILTHQRNFSAS